MVKLANPAQHWIQTLTLIFEFQSDFVNEYMIWRFSVADFGYQISVDNLIPFLGDTDFMQQNSWCLGEKDEKNTSIDLQNYSTSVLCAQTLAFLFYFSCTVIFYFFYVTL